MKYFKNLWIIFIFSPVLLFAHPHIFVKASSKIVSDTKGIIGIEMVIAVNGVQASVSQKFAENIFVV